MSHSIQLSTKSENSFQRKLVISTVARCSNSKKVCLKCMSPLRKTSSDMMPVCDDCRDKVDNCYQRNATTPLLCSNLVREYMQCVEKHRKVGRNRANGGR